MQSGACNYKMKYLLLLQCINGAVVLHLEVFLSGTSIFAAAPVQATPSNESCGLGYYAIYTSIIKDQFTCHPCSNCSLVEGVLHPCTSTSNTICRNCNLLSMFSALNTTSGFRECHPCTNCTETHRHELVACGGGDSVCGSCLPGYFLGVVGNGETECLRCSRCPPGDGQTAIRWRECEEAGLDRGVWCSPGYVAPETTQSHSLTVTTSSNSVNTSLYYLGTDSFLSISNNPGNSNTGDMLVFSQVIIATAVSCVALTTIMCLLVVAGFVCARCRMKHSSSYHQIALQTTRNSANSARLDEVM